MIREGFIKSMSQVKNGQALLNRSVTKRIYYITKYSTKTENKKDADSEYDEPVKYSTSKAANWPACGTGFKSPNKPAIQPVILGLSFGIFLLYFGVLREENDIDEKLNNALTPEMNEFFFGLKKQQDKAISEYRKNM